MKRSLVLFVAACLLTMQSCGTIFKSNQAGKMHSSKLDISIVLLDALGLVLFIVPGIVAFTIDYLNGTLFLPYGATAKLDNTSPEYLQKVLAQHGIKVNKAQLEKARADALARAAH